MSIRFIDNELRHFGGVRSFRLTNKGPDIVSNTVTELPNLVTNVLSHPGTVIVSDAVAKRPNDGTDVISHLGTKLPYSGTDKPP